MVHFLLLRLLMMVLQDVASIFNAIREGDVEEVKNMISHGYDPNAVDYGASSHTLTRHDPAVACLADALIGSA